MDPQPTQSVRESPKVEVEYCGVCDYGGHCLTLAKMINEKNPTATIICKRGRQGSFEVLINEKLVYSKLQTMALPDYEEVVNVVSEVSEGMEPKIIKGQQPINCIIQ
ncbi:unnamed protein product [Leptosia nina]|uniref:Migration and invasion enhancer 1 n=1 Tax=Leptosia nina TaxID=320188 RepID=A0AAV1JA67_9NEOP